MERKSITSAVHSFFESYFFFKKPLPILGVIRILVAFVTCYLTYKRQGWMNNIVSDNESFNLLHRPSTIIDLLSVPFPLPGDYRIPFAIAVYVVGFFCIIGLFTRISLFLFGLLTIYICDVEAAKGFFNHEFSLTSQLLLVLAFIPGSTNYSADRFFKWFFQKNKLIKRSLFSALKGDQVPLWGLRLILIILACTYVTAGISKLRYGGLNWMDGKTLTYYLDGSASPNTPGKKPMFIGIKDVPNEKKWKDGFGIYSYSFGNRLSSPTRMSIGKQLSSSRFMIVIISISTLIFELCGFVLLFNGWPRIFYLIGAIAMHATIGVLMNLPFYSYQLLCLCLCFVDFKWSYFDRIFTYFGRFKTA